jgi:hypothetical protein
MGEFVSNDAENADLLEVGSLGEITSALATAALVATAELVGLRAFVPEAEYAA